MTIGPRFSAIFVEGMTNDVYTGLASALNLTFLRETLMAKAKVKLSLSELSITQKVTLTQTVVTQSTGNPNLPTSTTPALALLTAAASDLEVKFLAAETARQASQTATANQNNSAAQLDLLLTQFGNFVENATDGDEAKILSTGLSVRATNAPIGQLPQVTNFTVSAGDNAGELDCHWDSVRGAKSYRLEQSLDPNTGWSLADIVTRSQGTLLGRTSGTTYWLRAAAIGTAGQGPWSNPVPKVAP